MAAFLLDYNYKLLHPQTSLGFHFLWIRVFHQGTTFFWWHFLLIMLSIWNLSLKHEREYILHTLPNSEVFKYIQIPFVKLFRKVSGLFLVAKDARYSDKSNHFHHWILLSCQLRNLHIFCEESLRIWWVPKNIILSSIFRHASVSSTYPCKSVSKSVSKSHFRISNLWSVTVDQIKKVQKTKCIYFRILLLEGPSPPTKMYMKA